mmetsp:Transcript_21929/g.83461  ORF Transcript_21929/g.83461 Transcript_21929/m.83461 type:complete len:303 (+) Transcript_21929:2389-3297(+)
MAPSPSSAGLPSTKMLWDGHDTDAASRAAAGATGGAALPTVRAGAWMALPRRLPCVRWRRGFVCAAESPAAWPEAPALPLPPLGCCSRVDGLVMGVTTLRVASSWTALRRESLLIAFITATRRLSEPSSPVVLRPVAPCAGAEGASPSDAAGSPEMECTAAGPNRWSSVKPLTGPPGRTLTPTSSWSIAALRSASSIAASVSAGPGAALAAEAAWEGAVAPVAAGAVGTAVSRAELPASRRIHWPSAAITPGRVPSRSAVAPAGSSAASALSASAAATRSSAARRSSRRSPVSRACSARRRR